MEEFVPAAAAAVMPEPLEKARYLLGLAIIPVVPTLLFLLGRKVVSERVLSALDSPAVLACRDAVAAGGL
ncbi:MAG: hypothetical protein ACKOK8_15125, partial [Planctomycetia bacterium]